MSVRVMSAVFDLPDMGPTHRLIMLALADHADDAGRCYPSLERLAKRTGLSLRAVRSNLRQLEADGQIRTEAQGGPKGCNLYFVTPRPRQEMPPAGDAPGTSFPIPRQEMPPPPAGDAPEPSLTIIEPSKSNNARVGFAEFWERYPRKIAKAAARKAYDKAMKKARHDDVMFGLSQQMPAMLAKEQKYIPHPSTWLNQERWNDDAEQPSNARRDTISDATDRQIAFAARAARTPSEDCF